MEAINILKREKERILKALNYTNSQINDHNEENARLQQVKADYEETINNLDATLIKLGVDVQSYPLFQKIESERKVATTGDYINIRVQKPDDVPIIEFNGEVLENLQSVKFVWITRGDDKESILYPLFLDIQGLRRLDVNGEKHFEAYRVSLGKESVTEKFRENYREV